LEKKNDPKPKKRGTIHNLAAANHPDSGLGKEKESAQTLRTKNGNTRKKPDQGPNNCVKNQKVSAGGTLGKRTKKKTAKDRGKTKKKGEMIPFKRARNPSNERKTAERGWAWGKRKA